MMKENAKQESLISPVIKVKIDAWLKKYPENQKRSAVIPALKCVQDASGGWLSEAHLNAVADYLGVARIEVYEVATFYTMFNLKPIGRHLLAVCQTTSCFLCGSDKILAHLKQCLGINPGETTADGWFTLRTVECLAACGGAPVMQVDDRDYYENLTLEKVDEILEHLKTQGERA